MEKSKLEMQFLKMSVFPTFFSQHQSRIKRKNILEKIKKLSLFLVKHCKQG